MADSIDSFTRRKAPNAYVLFTTAFMNQYKAENPNDTSRFHGGIPSAINDPMIMQAWEVLLPEEKERWKKKAREEKHRIVTEYAHCIEQHFNGPENGSSEAVHSAPEAGPGGGSMARGSSGGTTIELNQPAQAAVVPLRPQSANLKRLLRPKKQRRKPEESKYAPSFFDAISTAKHFEEKRRRERSCLIEIWEWRSETDKNPILCEPFFLVSSQSFGLRGDMHAPGTLSCLEFTIRDGVKREFCCRVAENYSEWVDGASPDLYDDHDCGICQPPGPICRELGDWLRTAHKDVSSKTPVFFCLVDEYVETFDCLSILFSYKEGTTMRFQPYLLATTDDLFTALLQFFNVPSTFDNAGTDEHQPVAGASSSRAQSETFPLSRIIDQYYVEMAKNYACDSHQNELTAMEESAGGGDGLRIDKNQRCPLAVVRACAAFAKQWIETGYVDDRLVLSASPKSAEESDEKEKTSLSYAESMKSEDIDRFSYLNLSTGDASDRTVGSGSDRGTVAERRERILDSASDSSDDIIELKSPDVVEERPSHAGDGLHAERGHAFAFFPPDDRPQSMHSHTAAETSVQSWSCASSHASTVRRLPVPLSPIRAESASSQALVDQGSGTGAGAAVGGVGWTPEFRAMYDAQQRLPQGCRGLGRGMPLNMILGM